VSQPRLCLACGLWHRGSLCGLGGEPPPVAKAPAVTNVVTNATPETVSHAPAAAVSHASPGSSSARVARWQKTHAAEHAAKQRAYRQRKRAPR
jgi:hypothetical protein